MKRGPIIVAAALAAVIAVPPAQAATPFTAGTGDDPSLAVGSDGSGHVVWTRRGVDDRVGYCRVRPEGEACERTDELAFGGAGGAVDDRAGGLHAGAEQGRDRQLVRELRRRSGHHDVHLDVDEQRSELRGAAAAAGVLRRAPG